MRRNVKSYFTKNWGLKLVSLLLALVLWFVLIPEEKTFTEKNLDAPLEIYELPEQMVLMERPPRNVQVTVRAPNRLLPQITSANVLVVLNLKEATVAQTTYALLPNMVIVPVGAEVKDISPSQVNLRLEMTQEIMAKVTADLINEVPEGFELVQSECVPLQVRISGPQSKINDAIEVKTSPIDLSVLTQSMEIERNLILPDPDLRLVEPGTKVVVRLLIQEKLNEEEEADTKAKSPTKKKKSR